MYFCVEISIFSWNFHLLILYLCHDGGGTRDETIFSIIIGNMGSSTSVFLAEVGSLAICYGVVALLKSFNDEE
jgi:hypothetical protein